MKKLSIFLLLLVFLTTIVSAGLNPIQECSIYCTKDIPAIPVGKFEWEGSQYVEEEAWNDPTYEITVTGDDNIAYWTSVPEVCYVVEKESGDYYTYEGGNGGTIYSQDHGISHITFCGDDFEDVPEFSTIGAGIVLIGACGYILKKRKK